MTNTSSLTSPAPDAPPERQRDGGVAVAFVVAVADNGVIGRNGGLPWRLSSDLKLFRRLTMGKPIIMGRKTWVSLPKRPLDGRDNIVVTRDLAFEAEGAHVAADTEHALRLGQALAGERGAGEVAVIGGAAIYEALIDAADRIYLTAVHGEPDGDTTFPVFDLTGWRIVSEEPIERGARDEFDATLRVMERVWPEDKAA
ncbi:MAG: dihydrofolate reductase [Alphaproteobacteria bacterium]|nr:dihydrofolate reductase [Alphaproteobacteria bacterium]